MKTVHHTLAQHAATAAVRARGAVQRARMAGRRERDLTNGAAVPVSQRVQPESRSGSFVEFFRRQGDASMLAAAERLSW